MSRRTRNHSIKSNGTRRFIDDITGETGYTNSYRINHRGQMVKPENFDPVPPQEINPYVPPIEPPINVRPKGPARYRAVKNVYDFPSSYLDRLRYFPNGILLAELNPDLVTIQLANLQSWEEIDVVWDNPTSQFTNVSWNPNINFIDSMYDGVFTYGTGLSSTTHIELPGED